MSQYQHIPPGESTLQAPAASKLDYRCDHSHSSTRAPRFASVADSVDNLILDLLEWIGPGLRPYAETLDAWRTSCPRLPVWEDATDLGFIERHHEPGHPAHVSVSASGVDHLRKHRQPPVGQLGDL